MWYGRVLRAIGLCTTAALAAAVAMAEDTPPAGTHPTTKCPFAVPDGRVVECFQLRMPSDHDARDARRVWLTAAVFHATAEPKAPYPVLYLEGGPGGDAGLLPETVDFWWTYLERNPWLARRDVIVFAQRGAAPSEPNLTCEPVWRWVRERLALRFADRENRFVTMMGDALTRCLDAFAQANAELGEFTTRPVARDAIRISRLLGYDRYDILAVSYGTRVALDMLRLAPRDARAVVLDSTLPPQVTSWDDSEAAVASFLDRVLALCVADAPCAAAYPDLGERLDRLVHRLDQVPPVVSVTVPFDPDPVKLWLDGTTLRRAIDEIAYESELIATLPAVIVAAEAGDLDALRPLLEGYVVGRWLYETTRLNRVPYGCSEFLLSDPASRPYLTDRIMWWRYAETDAAWCEELGLDAAGPAFVRPVNSGTPVLLLAGELDWVTPPAWAEDTAKTLPNGRVVRLPGVGHAAAFANDCGSTIVGAFLDDPAGWTDPPCLADLPPPFVIAP